MSGATKLTVHSQLCTRNGQVILERTVNGDAPFYGKQSASYPQSGPQCRQDHQTIIVTGGLALTFRREWRIGITNQRAGEMISDRQAPRLKINRALGGVPSEIKDGRTKYVEKKNASKGEVLKSHSH